MPIDHPLSPGGTTLAILDANVLLPPRLSDILLDLFLEGLYHPRWTSAIETEFIKHFGRVALTQNKTTSKAMAATAIEPDHRDQANRRLHCFRSAVGTEYEVFLYDTPEYKSKVPSKVDAGDIHVASASIVLHTLSQEEGGADKVFIVSNNLAHLAVKEMQAIGISVVSPGAFIGQMNKTSSDRVEKALLRTIQDLTTPSLTPGDLLRILIVHGATETANFYSRKWGVKIPQ